jgi:hypothetical protein
MTKEEFVTELLELQFQMLRQNSMSALAVYGYVQKLLGSDGFACLLDWTEELKMPNETVSGRVYRIVPNEGVDDYLSNFTEYYRHVIEGEKFSAVLVSEEEPTSLERDFCYKIMREANRYENYGKSEIQPGSEGKRD